MDENQIEVFAASGETPDQLATTTSVGLAKFSPEDFMVTVDGEVQALTKVGIAFTLAYEGVNDVSRYYTIDTNIGRQNPKIGDVGLVIADKVQPEVGENGNQNGTLVRLTAVRVDEQVPIVWYGEVIGNIIGPQGKVGPQALQYNDILQSAPDEYVNVPISGFNRTPKNGDIFTLYYVIKNASDNSNILLQAQAQINSIDTDSVRAKVTNRERITGPVGPFGTRIYILKPSAYVNGNILWEDASGLSQNDIIISSESIRLTEPANNITIQVLRGSMYLVDRVSIRGVAYTDFRPGLQSQDFQLGIWNLSEPSISGDVITFKYFTIENTPTQFLETNQIPYPGELGLCIDDNYPEQFGKFYTIITVDQSSKTVTTNSVGASIVGPTQDISLGQVTTIQNNADGTAGDATASMIVVDPLHKQLNLGIPAGQKGEQGIQGVQGIPGPAGVANVNARGAYDSSEVYVQNDLVYFNTEYTNEQLGGSYIRTENLPGQAGLTPKDNPTAWGLFVAEGAPGPRGPVGPVGPDGAVGASGALQAIFNSQVGNANPNVELSILYKGKFNVGDKIAFLCKGSFKTPYTTYQPNSIATGTVSAIGTLSVTFSSIDSSIVVLPSYDIITIQPVSGNLPVQGTFTEQQLNTLQGNDNAIIVRDNERYMLMDKQHDTGYLIYTHVGHNSTNNFNIKCITITVNTRAWVLTEQKLAESIAVQITSPPTATSGTLNSEEMSILQHSDNNYIMFNNEIYRLQDKSHETGYWSYSHMGFDVSNADFPEKVFVINVNNLSWLLKEKVQKTDIYKHTIRFTDNIDYNIYSIDSTPVTTNLEMVSLIGRSFSIHKQGTGPVYLYKSPSGQYNKLLKFVEQSGGGYNVQLATDLGYAPTSVTDTVTKM